MCIILWKKSYTFSVCTRCILYICRTIVIYVPCIAAWVYLKWITLRIIFQLIYYFLYNEISSSSSFCRCTFYRQRFIIVNISRNHTHTCHDNIHYHLPCFFSLKDPGVNCDRKTQAMLIPIIIIDGSRVPFFRYWAAARTYNRINSKVSFQLKNFFTSHVCGCT